MKIILPLAHNLPMMEFSSMHVSHKHDARPCCCVLMPPARTVRDMVILRGGPAVPRSLYLFRKPMAQVDGGHLNKSVSES